MELYYSVFLQIHTSWKFQFDAKEIPFFIYFKITRTSVGDILRGYEVFVTWTFRLGEVLQSRGVSWRDDRRK